MWPWWMKIPTEDFTDETLAIDDTHWVLLREMMVEGVIGVPVNIVKELKTLKEVKIVK